MSNPILFLPDWIIRESALYMHFWQKKNALKAVTDEEALNAAFCLTEMEGIIPALESAHALAVLEQKTFRPEEIVVINLSGRGDKDMQTYKRMNKFLHL